MPAAAANAAGVESESVASARWPHQVLGRKGVGSRETLMPAASMPEAARERQLRQRQTTTTITTNNKRYDNYNNNNNNNNNTRNRISQRTRSRRRKSRST